jgi:hypothetical protein
MDEIKLKLKYEKNAQKKKNATANFKLVFYFTVTYYKKHENLS